MKKIVLFALLLLLSACETVPLTGRQQLSLLPDDQMNALGLKEYRNILNENSVEKGTQNAQMVKRVGNRIKNAVETYFRQRGEEQRLNGYKWEFNLIDDNQANAFCLPGGKVAVYTGILKITKNDTGLAVVMGHEVAHAIANHGNERMSQKLMVQATGAALGAMISKDDPLAKQALITAFGVGSSVGVLLPFSRLHESEADHMGLVFMSMAGYDPHEAPKFWQRMAAAHGGKGGDQMEFLSTHPADATRIADLEKQIPEAMTYFKGPSPVLEGEQPSRQPPIGKKRTFVPPPAAVGEERSSKLKKRVVEEEEDEDEEVVTGKKKFR